MRFLWKRFRLWVQEDMKLDWENIIKSRLLWIAVACVAGLGLLLYLLSSVDSCRFQSKQDKLKSNVNSALQEISNINSQIANLNERKAEVREGIKHDTEALANSIYGREEAKKETNQAIANFERALNTNSNIDRSAEDILRLMKELDK